MRRHNTLSSLSFPSLIFSVYQCILDPDPYSLSEPLCNQIDFMPKEIATISVAEPESLRAETFGRSRSRNNEFRLRDTGHKAPVDLTELD